MTPAHRWWVPQIHIDNPDAELFLGVEARVSVHMAKSEGVVLVPVETVNTAPPVPSVG